MSNYHLAQLNIATMTTSLESPEMADFVGNLERVNTLAEASPGFVWRLKTDAGDATALRPLGDRVLVNLSVWEDVAALREFVFRSGHVEIMRRRREWFQRMGEAYVVLWWVPRGHVPDIAEACARLAALRAQGPSPSAFDFRNAFPTPDAPSPESGYPSGEACPAT